MARSLITGKSTAGGTVTVNWYGTSTAATIYVSATGASKSNPITADYDGAYVFWIENGHYTITNGTPTGNLEIRPQSTNTGQSVPGTAPASINFDPFLGSTTATLEAFYEGMVAGTQTLGGGTFTGPITTTDTTNATSINTGSFITDGGAGIEKALWVGGLANIAGVATLANATDSSSSTTGGTIITGGLGVAKKLFVGTTAAVGGVLTASDATASTSTATGSVVSSGGLGVAKDSYFGANVVQASANGANWVHGQVSELLALTSGASNHDSVANLLPANAVIEAVTARVTTTISGGSLAVGTITMSGVAVADETFVIGAQTFTWKAARGGVGEVTIGANQAAAVTNIVTAVTADLATVTAADGAGDTVVVTAVAGGTAGNAIVFTEASTNMAVDGAGTLGGTSAGVNVTSWTLADTATAARFAAANTTLTTSGNSIGIKQWLGGVATDAAGPTQAAAAKVRITTDQIVQAGAARITVFYRQFVAPTA